MADLGEALRIALATRLTGMPADGLRSSVERLIEAYRSGTPPQAPILASRTDVAAYAAYRMPATYAAVRAALRSFDLRAAPASLLDIGGGTGAATWAALDAFPELTTITVLDQVAAALTFGEELALGCPAPALRGASWLLRTLPMELPGADLVTVSYVLGELPVEERAPLVDAAATAAGVLVLIEPGTPAGYERILDARTRLIDTGRTIVAPCPHQGTCPIPHGRDWCHFGERVNRSALHRRIKDADLSFEDEKFSYVVAVRPELAVPAAGDRVLRRPVQRKGMVQLRLCTQSGQLTDRIVAKSHGADYKRARDVSWGDVFP
ncbi:MAG TPA: small ribosomal subunit Rsm22 family protein [Micromonosporaceae bacterium]